MTPQQHFQEMFLGWCLGLGFVFMVVLTGAVVGLLTSDAWKRRQLHRQRLEEIRQRAELAAQGMDPDYLKFLEEKAGEN